MRFIVFDLEATCIYNRQQLFDNEIIEIGAVKIENKQITDEFQSFVRPIINTELSKFCIDLTSITQKDVDTAEKFPIVLDKFLDWCYKDIKDFNIMFCSWGYYDRHQLEKDCNRFNLDSKFICNHISLKHQFQDVHKEHMIKKNGIGMAKALKFMRMPLDGTHHRGIDDARNISKIFMRYYDEWKY